MKRIAAVLLVMIVSFSIISYAMAERVAVVTADVLNIRDAPQGNKVGRIMQGEIVTIISGPDGNGYCKIMYKDQTYYAYGEYLDEDHATEVSSRLKKTKKVTTKIYYCDNEDSQCKCMPLMFVKSEYRLALRRKADYESERRTWLYHGTPVIVIDPIIRNGYIKVKTLDGQIGYTYAKHLSSEVIGDIIYEYELCSEELCCSGYECWKKISWKAE